MWSLGCILAEMLLGHALFPGSSTINQIERIMNTILRPSKVHFHSFISLDRLLEIKRKLGQKKKNEILQ